MEQRILQKTGEAVSLLGFGGMRLPLTDQKEQVIDVAAAQQMVDYAMDQGVNYYDTAYGYHKGNSAPFFGQALKKYPRESYKLANKLPVWLIKSEADAERIFQEQLEKCQVDYFDFYLLHNLNEEHVETMRRYQLAEFVHAKQAQGLVRQVGFSFHDRPPLLKQLLADYEWDFVQLQLNYLDWELQQAQQQYEMVTARGIPVIVMEPVRGGYLATLDETAMRIFEQAAPGRSAASWAMRYAASLPNVLTVLSGMSNLEQVKDNVSALTNFQPFTEEDYQTVEKVLETQRGTLTVPCTNCRYCMDCPSGVDIPRNFMIYNRYCNSENTFNFGLDYRLLGESSQAHHCVQCGQCTPQCPQNIAIPEYLEKIVTFAQEKLQD